MGQAGERRAARLGWFAVAAVAVLVAGGAMVLVRAEEATPGKQPWTVVTEDGVRSRMVQARRRRAARRGRLGRSAAVVAVPAVAGAAALVCAEEATPERQS